jgi:hypothetical protein
MENNVVTNKYTNEAYEYIVDCVSTKQAETLSANSLMEKSYAPNTAQRMPRSTSCIS